MTPKRDRKRPPARKKAFKEPKRRLLVVCEGKVSEQEYLSGFERWKRSATCQVVSIGLGQDPKNVVKEAKKKAKADRQYDEIWCVFDRDAHTRFAEACEMAQSNKFKLAVSNPCFELWLLLHHQDNPGIQERGDVQRMLKVHGVDSKHVSFEQYQGKYDTAHKRALRLETEANKDGEPLRNPTTGFFRLTESIAKQ